MLLTQPKFKEFTKKDIADAHKTTEVLTCLSFDSKDKVSEVVDKAVAAGGTEAREPHRLARHIGLQRAYRRAADHRQMPLERAAEAYEKMMRNEARFRMVRTTGV